MENYAQPNLFQRWDDKGEHFAREVRDLLLIYKQSSDLMNQMEE
mgnify:CR=1 FL=1